MACLRVRSWARASCTRRLKPNAVVLYDKADHIYVYISQEPGVPSEPPPDQREPSGRDQGQPQLPNYAGEGKTNRSGGHVTA